LTAVSSARVPLDQVSEKTVAEVMIARPKTLPGSAVVGDVRKAFANPSVRTVLLADDGIFRGAIERERLPAETPSDRRAADYADTQPSTVTPDVSIPEAMALLDTRSEPRLIVLDEDGATLRGLLCFNRSSSGFCVK
jgi:CBS domain-containing protein